MTNKEALAIVLELANAHPAVDAGVDDECGLTVKEKEALDQMQDYYNDLMEDDLIITQGDKKLKEMLED